MFNKEKQARINHQIKSPTVRVIHDTKQLGVFIVDRARQMAQELNLDLVEIDGRAKPPVCRIMDYGKFKFEQKIKEKENKKRQREAGSQLKEVRLRPGIDAHDLETKINQAKKFIEEGKKVQFNMVFRKNRELAHKERGFEIVKKVVQEMELVGIIEKAPKMDAGSASDSVAKPGATITCIVKPK